MALRAPKSDPNPFQVEAIKTLRAQKWTVDAIAAAFEVSPRTVASRLKGDSAETHCRKAICAVDE